MTLPTAPKRGGRGPRKPLHFGYLKGYKGEDLYGYLAGPVMWFEMHTSDLGSKPCLRELTGGELTCSKCKYGEPVCKGACGFYHANDCKPYMLWLDETRRDEYDRWQTFIRIKFGREKHKGAPVWATKCLNQEPKWTSSLPECCRAADLTETLLRTWGVPELVLWYRQTHGGSDKAVSPASAPTVAVKDDGEPFGPEYQGAAKRNGATVLGPDDPGYDAALARLRERARQCEPSENGHTKKPKPK